ncbi:hypothetical protein [Archangium sp.]|uniref:hypothetical protein n=1 Tax=Archangium sp. TaxID=1872627 RepID=UPI00286CDFE4|nr:hypothetical protein [Archangium sp.]
MSHLNSQWTLPGPSSTYHVVWWYAEAAKDTSRHVPMGTVQSLLRKWLVSCRLTLRSIDEALGGAPVGSATRLERAWDVEQLGNRIAEALRSGRMVVVGELPADASRSSTGGASHESRTPGKPKAVTVMVVDEAGNLVPDARYRLKTGSSLREGAVNSQGQARESNVDLDKLEITLLK